MTEEELKKIVSRSHNKGQIDGFAAAVDPIIDFLIKYKHDVQAHLKLLEDE